MKNFKLALLSALLFAGIFTSCTKEEEEPATSTPSPTAQTSNFTACDFAGYKVGSVGAFDSNGDEYTLTCTGTETTDGKEWKVLEYSQDTAKSYLRCDENYVYIKTAVEESFGGDPVQYDLILRMVKSNAKVGESWVDSITNEFTAEGIRTKYNCTHTVKSVNETRMINGKTYADVVKIDLATRTRMYFDNVLYGDTTMVTSHWYSPNYFLIEASGDGYSDKLKSFQP